jgi:hypothetical protein
MVKFLHLCWCQDVDACPDRKTWIDLYQSGIEGMFEKSCTSFGADFVEYGFPEASYSAATTLRFASPQAASVFTQTVARRASLNALSDLQSKCLRQKGLLLLMVLFCPPVVHHCVENFNLFLYLVLLSSTKGET